MAETFINITQIKPTNNNNIIKVYQIQPQTMSAMIMHQPAAILVRSAFWVLTKKDVCMPDYGTPTTCPAGLR